MVKKLAFNNNSAQAAREKIRAGIKQLVDAVKITLGPSGRVVMYEREFGDPVITKDGVTVAKQVELEDPMENMAAAMVRQAASRTADIAGDGTTTATIYTGAIYEAGIKSIYSGADPLEIRRGIDYATKSIIDELSKLAKPAIDIAQIKQVAVCSSNQDVEIGDVIASAMDQVGRDGVITIEEGGSLDTRVSVIDGLQFPRGYTSPQFATDPQTLMCEYDNPAIVITDQKIADLKTLLGILEMCVRQLKKPVVLIADDYSDECLTTLLMNRLRGNISVVAVKAPEFGDRRRLALEDIAIATGATLITKDGVDFGAIKPSHCGTCRKIRIDRDTTTILDGGGDEAKLTDRVMLLRSQIEKMAGDFDRERIQERLARLVGGVAQIAVGGATEAEVREKKDRIDDALHACKAATQEGILPGGAVAAIHAATKIKFDRGTDFGVGVDIVLRAIEAPLRQIALNTGCDDGVVCNTVSINADPNFGFDAVGRRYGNMMDFGIVVPAKVERIALQNAASIAGLLLTTDCMISMVRAQKQEATPPFPSLGM